MCAAVLPRLSRPMRLAVLAELVGLMGVTRLAWVSEWVGCAVSLASLSRLAVVLGGAETWSWMLTAPIGLLVREVLRTPLCSPGS